MRNIGKYKVERRIDRKARAPFVSSADTGDGGGVLAPPAPPVVPAPTNLVLSTALSFSAVTPGAKVIATWRNLEAYDLETYQVQIDTASTFATAETYRTTPNTASATIDNRRTNTLYYVRVRTVVQDTPSAWTAAATVTTPQDTTPPAAPTSQAATFINGGDLIVTWTNPTSENYRDTEISIYDTSGGTLYATLYNATGRAVWTAAQNLAATSGVGDPTLFVSLRARSWGNAFSSAVTASATKTRPATPGGIVQSWASDTGTAGADWTISWAAQTDATVWQLTINGGTARTIASTTYTYTKDANIAQNTSADPTLSYSLVAMDALGQSSTAAATGTATNAAPPTTALTAVGAVNAIAVTITPSTAADFAYYSLRIVKDGATQATVTTRATTALLDVGPYGSGTYQIGVTVVDAFAQTSTETLSTGGFLEPFTLTTFRAGARYRDSAGTSETSLDSLKDTNLTSGGVTYT